ncbi:MAG: metalloprotease PmbA [Pseudomonadales bacterium]|nr:metalloprotease PmbA [Pseudomonadales bacterium]
MDIDTDKQTLINCVQQALSEAQRLGACQAEVAASTDEGLVATVRKADVETVEFTKNHGFGITLYKGKSKGSSGTSDLSSDSVKRAVAAAWDIAQHTSEDSYAGLADAELMAQEFPDLDLFHPWQLQPQEAIEVALTCEASGTALPGIENSEGATVASGIGLRVYGNSHGFMNTNLGTSHSISCALIAGEGDGMQRDYWSTRHRVPGLLEDAAQVGRKAAERAIARLNPKKVPTGQYNVVYAAPLAGGLIGHILSAIAGGNLYRQSSFLLDKLDQKVADSCLSVFEKPHIPQGISSAACDGDGLPTQAKHFVDEGLLTSYMLSTYSARRLGMRSTANAGGARNVRTSTTGEDFFDLLKKLDRGVLVTELMGQGVNIVTGDYSRGAAGFWIENGEIQYPIQEFTVAGNLANIYQNIRAVGNDLDLRGNIQTGSILIEGLTVAGGPA